MKVSKPQSKKERLLKAEAAQKKNNPEMMLPGNQRANKLQKLKMKKEKKEGARRGTTLSFKYLHNIHFVTFDRSIERQTRC